MARYGKIVTLLAVACIGALFALFPSIQKLLIDWQIGQSIEGSLEAQNISDTRFEILFCGTGSPQFSPDRGQPCLGIIVGGKFFLFDTGQGAAQRLNQVEAPIRHLDTIFLTHLHSDHMSGLGETLHNGWLYGRQHLVEVMGPPGTEKLLAGFQRSYEDDIEERQRVVGEEYLDTQSGMGHATDVWVDGDELKAVYNKDGVKIFAFHVDHPDWPHAYGYRIEFQGKSVVISGDTKYSENLVKHAAGADYLIHEVLNASMMDMVANHLERFRADINRERLDRIAAAHTSTFEVAEAAKQANVQKLIVTHLIPPVPANALAESAFIEGMSGIFNGDILVARDNMRLVLIE